MATRCYTFFATGCIAIPTRARVVFVSALLPPSGSLDVSVGGLSKAVADVASGAGAQEYSVFGTSASNSTLSDVVINVPVNVPVHKGGVLQVTCGTGAVASVIVDW